MRRHDEHREGWVYFVQVDGGGPIKIGWSTNPGARLEELQAGNPLELRIVGLILVPRESSYFGTRWSSLEQQMHRRFESARIRGEWYRLTNELAVFLRALAASEKAA